MNDQDSDLTEWSVCWEEGSPERLLGKVRVEEDGVVLRQYPSRAVRNAKQFAQGSRQLLLENREFLSAFSSVGTRASTTGLDVQIHRADYRLFDVFLGEREIEDATRFSSIEFAIEELCDDNVLPDWRREIVKSEKVFDLLHKQCSAEDFDVGLFQRATLRMNESLSFDGVALFIRPHVPASLSEIKILRDVTEAFFVLSYGRSIHLKEIVVTVGTGDEENRFLWVDGINDRPRQVKESDEPLFVLESLSDLERFFKNLVSWLSRSEEWHASMRGLIMNRTLAGRSDAARVISSTALLSDIPHTRPSQVRSSKDLEPILSGIRESTDDVELQRRLEGAVANMRFESRRDYFTRLVRSYFGDYGIMWKKLIEECLWADRKRGSYAHRHDYFSHSGEDKSRMMRAIMILEALAMRSMLEGLNYERERSSMLKDHPIYAPMTFVWD